MNAVKLRAVAEPIIELSPLDRAREIVAELKRQLDAINTAMERAENTSSPTEVAATAAQGLRQRLTAIFARMLKAGSLDTATPEITTLTSQLASAEDAERQSAAIAAARRSVVADYQAQATELRSQLAVATVSLKELLFTAARADIEQRLITAYLQAAHQLADAKAALDGAGIAHCAMAQDLRQHGLSVQALGTDLPERVLILHPTGFGISSHGAFNTHREDCAARTEAARVDFSGRW